MTKLGLHLEGVISEEQWPLFTKAFSGRLKINEDHLEIPKYDISTTIDWVAIEEDILVREYEKGAYSYYRILKVTDNAFGDICDYFEEQLCLVEPLVGRTPTNHSGNDFYETNEAIGKDMELTNKNWH